MRVWARGPLSSAYSVPAAGQQGLPQRGHVRRGAGAGLLRTAAAPAGQMPRSVSVRPRPALSGPSHLH